MYSIHKKRFLLSKKEIGDVWVMNVQININKNETTYSAPQTNKTQTEEQKVLTQDSTVSESSQRKEDCGVLTHGKPLEASICSMPAVNTEPTDSSLSENNKFSFEKGMVDMFTSFMNSFKEMMQQYMSQIKEMVSSIVESFKGLLPQASAKPQTPVNSSPPVATRTMESFAERMPKILSGHTSIGHINEADLQAGVIAYQLYQKSEDAEQYFLSKLGEQDRSKMTPTQALKAALIATQEAGKISKLEAEFLYKLSHRASQLDQNHAEVSEAKHGAGTMDIGNAIKGAEIVLAHVIGGSIILEPRPLY